MAEIFFFGLPAAAVLLVVILGLRRMLALIQKATEGGLETGAGKRQFLETVFPTELRYLIKRRKVAKSEPPGDATGKAPSVRRNLVGLAISGGGIRSATFGLGMLQALHSRGIFQHIDYVSTVSGGGFIGGCLTTFLSGKARKDARLPAPFPFEHRQQEAEEPAVEYLRNHARYLAPSGGIGWVRMAWAWARGVALNTLVVLPWMAFVATLVGTLTYQDLRELANHPPHRTIAVSELETRLGETGLEVLEHQLQLQLPDARRRWTVPATDPAPPKRGRSDTGPAKELEYALFYPNEAERWLATNESYLQTLVFEAIREEVLPPDPEKLKVIRKRIEENMEELFESMSEEAQTSEEPPAWTTVNLLKWAELQVDPTELAVFLRAAADMAERKKIELDDPEAYFETLDDQNLDELEARREKEQKLLAVLLPLDPAERNVTLYRDLLPDHRALRRIARALEQKPGDLRQLLLRSFAGSPELSQLAETAKVDVEELNGLAAAARRQDAVLHKIAQSGEGLEKRALGRMADRLAPHRQELLAVTALGDYETALAHVPVGERPHSFDRGLLEGTPRTDVEPEILVALFLPKHWRSLTHGTLRLTLPLLLLCGLIYLRHSGAGAPPTWKAYFRVAVPLVILAVLASLVFEDLWKNTAAIVLVVTLLATPLALPILERILTISDLESRRRGGTTLIQRLRREWRRPDASLLRRRVEKLVTVALFALAAALLIDLQKPILDYFHHNSLPRPSAAGLGLTLLGLLVVIPILGGLPPGHRMVQAAKKLALAVFALAGLGSMFLLYLWMAEKMIYGSETLRVGESVLTLLDYGILAGAMFFAAYELANMINANDSSMNGFYRDRLGEAYLVGEDKDGILGPEQDLELQAICPDRSGSPYHLINTALNLQGSKDESLRGRNSSFFMFSRDFIGSRRTGFCSTRQMAEIYGPVHLGTAVAVSAAAASPNMGTFTLPGLTPLLTLLNARLGYWLPNPGRVAGYFDRLKASRKLSKWSPRRWLAFLGNLLRRSRMRPGGNLLWKEISGGLTERGDAVNVSDGGHLENLGAYELLRRRCKFIFVSDAESDPGMHCGSLAALLRYARNDLGIDINIFLDDLTPDEHGRCRQHAALGRIQYPPTKTARPETGYLLYLKSAVTGDEDLVIREYRAKHPSFPHESTADQFFTEDQFEAYRSLGFHTVTTVLGDPEPLADFAALTEWFEELVVKLAPASGAPPLRREVHEVLRRINERLERPEFAAYFHELHPELPAAGSREAVPEDGARRASGRQMVLLVTQQLEVMSEVLQTLGLNQRRSQMHPAHRGWMSLFRRWASSPIFKDGYRSVITGFPTRLQFFCELVLGLELRLVWQDDPADAGTLTLELEVEGAAGEPPVIGWATRGDDETGDQWELRLRPGFDGPEMTRRAKRSLRQRGASD